MKTKERKLIERKLLRKKTFKKKNFRNNKLKRKGKGNLIGDQNRVAHLSDRHGTDSPKLFEKNTTLGTRSLPGVKLKYFKKIIKEEEINREQKIELAKSVEYLSNINKNLLQERSIILRNVEARNKLIQKMYLEYQAINKTFQERPR